jgi:hypothetical protein
MDIVTIFFAYVLYFLLVHWVADFVLQNDKMALNKSTSNYWLGMHVMVYSFATIVLWFIFFWITDLHQYVKFHQYVEAYLALFIMHFITDYITSRITGKYFRAKKNHEFFVTIGFDQWLHYVQIFTVFNYIILK